MTRDDRAGKADLDIAERTIPGTCMSDEKYLNYNSNDNDKIKKKKARIEVGQNLLPIHRLARNTKEAKAVKNRCFEATHFGKCGVDM